MCICRRAFDGAFLVYVTVIPAAPNETAIGCRQFGIARPRRHLGNTRKTQPCAQSRAMRPDNIGIHGKRGTVESATCRNGVSPLGSHFRLDSLRSRRLRFLRSVRYARRRPISSGKVDDMAKTSTKPRAVATTNDAPRGASQPARATDVEIADRAYDLYLARGREDGHDLEDWLQAERELNGLAVEV